MSSHWNAKNSWFKHSFLHVNIIMCNWHSTHIVDTIPNCGFDYIMITSAYFWYGIAQGLVGLLQPTQILHLCLSESCYQLKCIITLYTDKIDFFVYILLYSICFIYMYSIVYYIVMHICLLNGHFLLLVWSWFCYDQLWPCVVGRNAHMTLVQGFMQLSFNANANLLLTFFLQCFA